jgi:hypothetical protein
VKTNNAREYGAVISSRFLVERISCKASTIPALIAFFLPKSSDLNENYLKILSHYSSYYLFISFFKI